MTATAVSSSTAERVVEQLGPELAGPWEVFAEHLVHHEIHYIGRRIELSRGPVEVEGYSLRLFRPSGTGTGLGFSSSNDLSPGGLRRTLQQAELTARHSAFPAPSVELPGSAPGGVGAGPLDPRIRDRPGEALLDFAAAVLNDFPDSKEAVPSFGSVRATYGLHSVMNSSGLSRTFPSTLVEFEWAVKAIGGPEGAAAGEYWVNREAGRLDRKDLAIDVPTWLTRARDVRRAKPPASGMYRVLFPIEVLQDIVPAVLGFRLSGAAELRGVGLPVGSPIGAPELVVVDDPTAPWCTGSGPCDDEGQANAPRTLVEGGVVRDHLYDLAHAAALKVPPTGSGYRARGTFAPWIRFTNGVTPGPSNLIVRPGLGGEDSDLMETVGDGIWLDQLGYAFPDPLAGTYGGEIRIGYRIRGGKLAEPLRGGTVGGRVVGPSGEASLLSGVTAIGSALRSSGNFMAPTLLSEKISVAGAR
ncbi:MAG: TldD/PmbA family protein [Thermoplasmata archaeon]